MKTKLLLVLIALTLLSCSKDDNSGNNPSENNGEEKLREIIQTEFNDNGSVKQTVKIEFDDNDRALVQSGYDGTGALISKQEFVYNSKGLLESKASYTVLNGSETPDYNYTFTYDSNDRVIAKSETGTIIASTTYAYNANNTITVIRNVAGTDTYATYHIDNDGKLFKKTTETETELLTYTGANILNYTNGTLLSSFVYDGEHTPKGQQHNVIVNLYKGNRVNALMLEGLTAVNLGSTQYLAQRTDDSGIYAYEYQFDDEGYPVKLRCFKNESSIPFSIREVYYK